MGHISLHPSLTWNTHDLNRFLPYDWKQIAAQSHEHSRTFRSALMGITSVQITLTQDKTHVWIFREGNVANYWWEVRSLPDVIPSLEYRLHQLMHDSEPLQYNQKTACA